MQGKRPTQVTGERDEDDTGSARRRAVARYAVPVAVVGVTAATIGLVPAFAGSGAPDLPKITAEELVAKVAKSDVRQLSGTVKISTDLGLPALPDLGSAGGEGAGGSTADPQAKLMELASGSHTLRIAADGPDKHRLSVIDDAAEYSVVQGGDEVWAYDSGTNSAFHATAPQDGGKHDRSPEHARPHGPQDFTPQEFAQQALKAVDDTTSVAVDGTAKVAGRDAYVLRIAPRQSGSTIESVRIAVDARTWMPLKVTLAPSSGGKPIVDAGFTSVDFAKPDAKTFTFTPPKGAKVTEEKDLDQDGPHQRPELPLGPGAGELGELGSLSGPGAKTFGKGWATVVQVKTPDGAAAKGAHGDTADQKQLLDMFGDKVTGKFGSGRVFSTRLFNALLTDDGTLYAGAVDKATLVKTANQAE